ncbi:hypothetical protein HDF23_004112 [Mucilaginibacter lappiensis]|uniref:DUF3108 domain-containing protein n=1 Tax=Mucilaginibacter lappiensis TaxID=354630 RepID=A0ABR6PQ62_9SPHI|nr:DUF3108 domain-containing protein [Mucilaginibacter lappiensis]MBB6111344.1 hypothetical protein [Mucilaginibacter lappiensis]
MRKSLFYTMLFILWGSKVFSQELTKISEPVFKVGEKLSYKMKYGVFTAAEADIRVEASDKKLDGPAFHLIAEGKTAGSFDLFYKVRNKYESYVDQNTLMPYFYTENRREGKWKHTDNVTFDHKDGKVKADKGVFAFKGQTFDFVSAYYFARTIDVSKMKVGEKFELQYFLEDGFHSMGITYVGTEVVSCSMGKFNCLKFNPTIIPGRIFRKDSKLYLWITNDGNRIPVKAHVEVILGSVTMDLQAASGLKYPLNPVKN